MRRDVGEVYVQMFDVALANWVGEPPGLCVHSRDVRTRARARAHGRPLLAVTTSSSRDYKLGNIAQTHLLELVASPQQRAVRPDKRDTLPRYCRECDVRFACHGGCPKDRFITTPDGEPGLNYLCAGYKAFFHHIDRPMRIMGSASRTGARPSGDHAALPVRGLKARAQRAVQLWQRAQMEALSRGPGLLNSPKGVMTGGGDLGEHRNHRIRQSVQRVPEVRSMAQPDRSKLPIRQHPFAGVANRTLDGSQPDWETIGGVDAPDGAPNVLLVLIDDAGFGNPATFGGPIDTPNYTRMARRGLSYNRFHVTALCSPTRAALLTGRNSHAVGFGSVGEFSTGFPGYTAFVPDDCAPFPRILRDNGYSTAAFGKWHLTPDGQQGPAGPFTRWPVGWGFDYFYGFLGGRLGAVGSVPDREPEDHRHSRRLLRRGRVLLPARRHGGQDDRVVARGPRTGRREALLRLLLHGLQPRPAPRLRSMGGEVQGQVRPGLGQAARGDVRPAEGPRRDPGDAELTPRDDAFPAWDDVPDKLKAYYARQMEVYAGYSENADYNVGRVLDAIDELGELDNTLVLWIWGDNGASMEGTITGSFNELTMQNGIPLTDEMQLQLAERYGGMEAWGNQMMAPHYSAAWAWAGNTPFQWGKQVGSHLGGTRNPLVAHWPERIGGQGAVRSHFTHVIDMGPTILDIAGIPMPTPHRRDRAAADARRRRSPTR